MPTVRITEETRAALWELARQTGQPMQELLARAVEAYRRQRILEQTNAAYAALRANPAAWQEEHQERAAWNATLADGLDGDSESNVSTEGGVESDPRP
ncbi:MAG: ribbon-helix-helix protein, CopG family [Chloroflexi bacterium]|nr:ribbon-helix-helix protein, CopG family [Chloroflexota bacterium]